MGATNGIYEDVFGAPFRIGQPVQVIDLIDEAADSDYMGKQGVIIYFEYTCGCGQSYPDDPMIGVRFEDDTAEFWKEKLHELADKLPLPTKGLFVERERLKDRKEKRVSGKKSGSTKK